MSAEQPVPQSQLKRSAEIARLYDVYQRDGSAVTLFKFERWPDNASIMAIIAQCEGKHVQQISYSSYMGALTQVCFTEQVVRGVFEWDENRSWKP